MGKHRKFHKNKKSRIRWKLILAGLTLLALGLLIDSQLRPVIQTMAAYQAKNYAVEAINDAVYEQVSGLGVQYDDLVRINVNEAGDVTSLQTDIVSMNRLQSSITKRVVREASALRQESIRVPLGTMVGGPFFSGRGPDVEILLVPANFVETSITNVFDSAGINQTRHQIMLSVKMNMSAIIPGYSVSTDVSTNICLAETVIVGLVPEAYTLVGDGTDPLVGMIEDYNAQNRGSGQ